MANDLAIATATQALVRRLKRVLSEFPGVDATAKRPEKDAGDGNSRISIFLYQISPNPALRNHDLPTRDADGRSIRRPTAALDLHYLLSFTGDELQLVPQRMLGQVVAALHSEPALSRTEIELASQGEPWLAESDLKDEIEQVKFTMSHLTLDELSKLWSVFVQIPYELSVAYDASVVLIEADVETREALPVRDPGVDALPIRQPVIEAVNGGKPLVGRAPLEIEITGRHLRGPVTLIRVDAEPPRLLTPASDTRIVLPDEIATTLAAGAHSLQVIHEVPLGSQRTPHHAVESNAYRIIVRPTITITHQPGDPKIVVGFVPPIRQDQVVRLLLNEVLDPLAGGRDPRFVTLDPDPSVDDDPGDQRAFDAGPVPAGTYVVRARVDKAESLTTVTTGNGAPRPVPVVTLP